MLKKINPFKKKAETTSSSDNHHQAAAALSQIKQRESKAKLIKIKITSGYILVAEDNYLRKKRYYHTLFGADNIIL